MEVKHKAGDRNWWCVHVSDESTRYSSGGMFMRSWEYTISKEGAVVHRGEIERHEGAGKPFVSECLAHFMAYMSGVCFGLVEQAAREGS